MSKLMKYRRLKHEIFADIQALDECLDRIGCPKASDIHQSLDRRAEDDEPRPSLVWRLGWLEGRMEGLQGLLEATPALERVAAAARVLLAETARRGVGNASELQTAVDDLERVHMTFAVQGEE